MRRIRLGIIGAGGIAAKMHLPELAAEGDRCEVVLLAGRRESRLRTLCDQFDVPHYTSDYSAVLSDPRIDAVCIATPHPLHVEWGVKALEAGKHVFMQKPLSDRMDEADMMVKAVEKSDRIFLCLPHFSAEIWTIRKMIREGRLGKIATARARASHGGPEVYYREILQIFGEPPTDDLWFFDSKRAGVGALFDMGVYAVARLVALLGSAKKVSALTATVEKPTDLEDTATIILEMENGALATAETSWCDPGRTWALSVHGTTAKIEAPLYGGVEAKIFSPTALDRDNAPIRAEDLVMTESPGTAHHHFLNCIEQNKQPPLSHVWAARHVTEILLAALKSAATGESVEIESEAEVVGENVSS